MSYEIFTDSSSNIPINIANELDIHILPLSYYIDDVEYLALDENNSFDYHTFYKNLRKNPSVKTSLVNSQRFISKVEPFLINGKDILFIGLSSGVSGTFQSSVLAAQELMIKYPERNIILVDSLAASLGEGMLVMEAAKLKKAGKDIREVAEFVETRKKLLCQYFMVDDLMFLKRGGRLPGAAALIGSMLGIKPVLKGSEEGKIVLYKKTRGKKQTLQTLANIFSQLSLDSENSTVCISHADSYQDAKYLEKIIKLNHKVKNVIIADFEPVTGSHAGPGAVALFFMGKHR